MNQANMGNNDIHFWGLSEQHVNLCVKHIMVKVGLLMENKEILSNYFSGNKGIPHSIVGIKGTVIYFQLKFPLLLNRR